MKPIPDPIMHVARALSAFYGAEEKTVTLKNAYRFPYAVSPGVDVRIRVYNPAMRIVPDPVECLCKRFFQGLDWRKASKVKPDMNKIGRDSHGSSVSVGGFGLGGAPWGFGTTADSLGNSSRFAASI